MANLLDRASVVLTPTAYNNGEALCIKPDDGSGDFDFSRNSAATRVNAQGLVENVQILSSNLVQNGDFSEEGAEEVSNGSFSQEGAELVTNGSFDTDSNWNKQTSNWTISNGYAVCDGLQTTNSSLFQDLAVVNGNSYRIDFTITDSANDLNLILGATTIGQYGDGTHTVYVEKDSGGARIFFQATASNAFQGSIDNVSVREVGQDWTLGTGWSIGEDKAISDGSVVGNSYLISTGNTLTIGKTYKVQYTVLDYISGKIKVTAGQATQSFVDADGTYTEYMVATSTEIVRVQANSNFIGSITNISVKEVGMDWVLGSGWSIGENKAIKTSGTGSSLVQSVPTTTIGKTYKLTFDAIVTSGVANATLYGITIPTFSTSGSEEHFITSTSTSGFNFYGNDFFNGSITNISIIEITDDTNLPRISYENFSYQDALGSELITNGDFATDTGWILTGLATIGNGVASFVDDGTNTNTAVTQINVISINKTYKVTFDIVRYVLGGVQLRLGNATAVTNELLQGVGSYTMYINSGSIDGNYNFQIKRWGGAPNFDFDIDNVSVKEYLGQEVVPDSGCGSWLFEPQSTNLITQSELFSDASWLKESSATLGLNTYLSPSGENNASELNLPSTLSRITYVFNSTGVYTFSVYLKSDTDGTISIRSATGNPAVTKQVNLTDKWQRFDISVTDGNYWQVIKTASDTLTSVYIWGAQLEQQSYATSYIPTSGSSVTRNQDLCTNGGSLASINSTSGVLYFEAKSDNLNVGSISINDGTISNRITARFRSDLSKIQLSILGSTDDFNLNSDAITLSDYNKIAIVYNNGDYYFFINGVKGNVESRGTFSANTFTQLDFNRGGGAEPFFGKTKCLAVWKEALSDAELTELTTI